MFGIKEKNFVFKTSWNAKKLNKKIRAVSAAKSTSRSSWWGFEVDTVDFKVDGFLRGKVDDFLKSRPPWLRLQVDSAKWKAF